MYYSSGNYEAFAPPKSPRAWTTNPPTLSAAVWRPDRRACYLVRDGQMKNERVHILEKGPRRGACDGWNENIGYVMRGGREMDNHFEVMWDLFHSIPPSRPRA